MPRTLPAAISGATTDGATLAWLWLVELRLVGGAIYYLSSGEACTFGGHSYQANRVKSVSGIVGQYIDGLNREFGNGSVALRGLSDDGSTSLPFVGIEGGTDLDGGKIFIHGFDAISATGITAMWHGYVKGRTYDGSDHSVTIEASFLWDLPTASIPSSTLQQEGFGTLDTNTVKESIIDDTTIPIVIGIGPFKIRPNIYYSLTIGNVFRVNGVISGTRAGLPFLLSDVIAANIKLFDITPAISVNFHVGADSDTAPHNSTVFPDLLAHNNVAYFSADFPIDASNKDKLDNIAVDDIRMRILNGRPIKSTGLVSQNAALILQDVLTDGRFGFGIDVSDFSSITATANASGLLWQGRLELHDSVAIGDWVQGVCRQTAMFVTFNDGKIQIGQKSGSESSVATFATTRSSHAGGRIVDDKVTVTFESSDELDNQINVKYRLANRHQKEIIAYDETAQTRTVATGGLVRKVNKQDYEFDLLFDPTQVGIAASMLLREQQNANMVIEFNAPIAEGAYPSPGELITVWSEDIPNNAGNSVFRVIAQPFDTGGDIPRVGFRCKVYKPDVYAYSTSGISIDEIRSGSDTSSQGRPPDVTPVSVVIIDKTTNDTGGVLENLRATWTYPTVDLSGDAAAGTTHEYPIHSVALYWRYTDEDVNAWRRGNEILYPVTSGDIAVDFHKNKIVEVMFVALSLSRSHGSFGYVEDPTKIAALTANFSGITATVDSASPFLVGDYTRCEFEINKVRSKAGNVLTMEPGSGTRTAYFGSSVITHPSTTQIAVAKQNYPTLQVNLSPPRFTYPVVTLTDILQRGGDGVRVRWSDVNPDNLERYYVPWSKDADAGTNVNKLGSSTPAWYLANPLAPPSGVFLKQATKQQTVVIPQEDIGPVGTAVFVRVFARNGKQNYSSAMSSPVANSSVVSGGTTPPADFPFPPNIAHLLENAPEITPEGLRARCRFRLFPYTSTPHTFAENGVTSMRTVFNVSTGKVRPEFPVDDTSASSIDVIQYFTFGELVTWVKNVAWNSGGEKASSGSVAFYAGASQTNAAAITGLAVSGLVAIDEKHSYLTFGYNQPGPPVVLSHALILSQNAGESAFSREKKIPLLSEPSNQVPGAKTFTEKVKHPKKTAVQWKVRLVSIDGTTIESAVFNNTSPDVDTGAPNNGTAITITHAAIKNGRTLIVRFALPTVQMVSHTRNTLIIHDNNATGAGRRFFDPISQTWVAAYSDGTTEIDLGKGSVPAMNLPASAVFVAGRTTIYVKIGVYNNFNGGSVTYSPDLPALNVGQIPSTGVGAEPVNQDAAVPDPSAVQGVFRYDGGKELLLECPLPTANMNTFSKVEVAIQVQAFGGTPLGFLARTAGGAYTLSPTEFLFDVGQANTFGLNIKKVSIRTLAPTSSILFFYYYVSNALGRSVNHSNGRNIFLDLDVFDYLGTRNVPVTIDVTTSMYANQNHIDNGDFDKNATGTNTVMSWYRWQTGVLSLANIGSTVNSIRASSPGIVWSITQHNVAIIDGSFYLVRPIKKILKPGMNVSLSMLLRAAVNGFSPTVKAWIVKDGAVPSPGAAAINLDNANLLTLPLNIPTTAIGALSSSAYKLGGNYSKCPLTTNLGNGGSPNLYANLWLVVGVPAGFVSPQQLILDRVKLNDGAQPSTFSVAVDEVPGVVDDANVGILPANVGDLVDSTYTPSGDLGGYTAQGGLFQ